MHTLATLLHRIAYRLEPARIGEHRITILAGTDRFVFRYSDHQHPGECDCE